MSTGLLQKDLFVPCLINEGVEYAIHDKESFKVYFQSSKEAEEFLEKVIKENPHLKDKELKIYIYKRAG